VIFEITLVPSGSSRQRVYAPGVGTGGNGSLLCIVTPIETYELGFVGLKKDWKEEPF
jgi:hypothetical protein